MEKYDEAVAKKREGEIIKGAISMMRVIRPFTIEEVVERNEQGLPTPFDLMPHEFWCPTDEATGKEYHRFGEEMLGKDF